MRKYDGFALDRARGAINSAPVTSVPVSAARVTASGAGAPGPPGPGYEVRVDSGAIQGRQAGGSWTTLIALSELTGAPGTNGTPGTNGREVELSVSATHVRWRLVGDTPWTNLVTLSAITGPQGIPGTPGSNGAPGAGAFIQAFAPGSFTVPTDSFAMMVKRASVTGSQRIALQGNSRLRVA